MTDDFGIEEIRALLAKLGTRLAARGIDGDIRIVGGAAIAFTGSTRRRTKDIDASYANPAEVEAVAREMAAEYGLPSDWINSSAAAWIPPGATWLEVDLDAPIHARAASAETLLAMKLSAARERDLPDIQYLAQKLHVGPEEAARIAEDQYGDDDVAYTRADREDAVLIVEEAISMPTPNPDPGEEDAG